MDRPGVFLTAEWRNLLMLNYAVDPLLLRPYVPAGTELDAFEDKTYVSLIGFQFNQTRVRGLAIPFHRSFEEMFLAYSVSSGVCNYAAHARGAELTDVPVELSI